MGRRTVATLIVAGCVVVVGCSGGDPPAATATSTGPTRATSTTSVPTAPTTTTTSTAAADPNIPVAARSNTANGAVAFTKYYFALANRSWREPNSSLLIPFSGAACSICAGVIETAKEYEQKKRRVDREPVLLDRVGALSASDQGQDVLIDATEQSTRLITFTGDLVRENVGGPARFVATVKWNKAGWIMAQLHAVKP